jgi:hypothetical protein
MNNYIRDGYQLTQRQRQLAASLGCQTSDMWRPEQGAFRLLVSCRFSHRRRSELEVTASYPLSPVRNEDFFYRRLLIASIVAWIDNIASLYV